MFSFYRDKIVKLTTQLFPNGRAFKNAEGSLQDKLIKAMAESEARAFQDAVAVLDAILPDNANFTADDATDWERRLGIAGNSATPLADRMAAIKRKMNHPGTIKARQNWRYIEAQLQAAGFEVKVYENRFPDGMGGYETQSPQEILGAFAGAAYHADDVYHGTIKHGGQFNKKIANYIEESKDAQFIVGSNYRSTFYIAGATISTFADVPAIRKDEFRQLILQLKPAQTVGYLFVNYV